MGWGPWFIDLVCSQCGEDSRLRLIAIVSAGQHESTSLIDEKDGEGMPPEVREQLDERRHQLGDNGLEVWMLLRCRTCERWWWIGVSESGAESFGLLGAWVGKRGWLCAVAAAPLSREIYEQRLW